MIFFSWVEAYTSSGLVDSNAVKYTFYHNRYKYYTIETLSLLTLYIQGEYNYSFLFKNNAFQKFWYKYMEKALKSFENLTAYYLTLTISHIIFKTALN